MDFSCIPISVALKDLENFILPLLQEIGINLDKSCIVAHHRLGKTVKFLNRKDAENIFSNKKKLKDVDISCLLSDDEMICMAEMTWPQEVKTIGGREVCLEKEEFFVSQNLCSYYRYLCSLVKEKKEEGLIFDFLIFNRTIYMRALQDSHVINITHESDIWYFFSNFLDKTSLLGSFGDSWFVIFFHKLLCALLFPR